MKNRLTNYMLKRGLFHLFLLTCAAVFLYPFIWMMVTSVKTGPENLKKDILPAMPAFKAQSPYVRQVIKADRPEECTIEKWDTITPHLLLVAQQTITLHLPTPSTQWTPQATQEAIRSAAEYATMKTVKRMPSDVWEKPQEAIVAQFKKSLAQGAGGIDAVLKRAVENGQSRMIINGIQVRSKAGKVIHSKRFKTTPEIKISPSTKLNSLYDLWPLLTSNATRQTTPTPSFKLTGPGKLAIDSDGKLIICSDFTDSDAPLTIQYHFSVDTPPEQLHRVSLEMTYDDTWHQIDAQLTLNHTHYKGSRTKWAGENEADALTLQFPDDEVEVDWGKRPWIKLEGPTPKNDGAKISNMVLTIKLTASGTATARYGKIKRNYERIFFSMPFWNYVLNSVIITVLMVLGAVFSSCFVAYAFARLKWPGRSIAFMILLSTMMLPPQVTMIPQFLEWRMLGWYNTLNPIWLPTWFGIAFFIFLMVQQMKGIPRDLEEAAEVDGMNRLQIWWYVIVPLVRPGMAAIAIMSFMAAWNEFMAPLIYLRDMGKFPLSVGIYAMGADETMNNDMAFIMAGNLLMTVPVIIIFFAFQRYFIQGVATSGVKG